MKPTEKQIDRIIKEMYYPAGEELDQRIDALFQREQELQNRQVSAVTIWRTIMKSKMLKLALTVSVTIAILAGIGLIHLPGTPKGLVFADVIKPFYTARCISYELIIDDHEPAIQDWVMDSKIRRITANMPWIINIIDFETSKILTLDSTGKKAYQIDLKGLPQMPPNHIAMLCNLFKTIQDHQDDPNTKSMFSIENLDSKTQDSRTLDGLVLKGPNVQVEIWVDASTQIPVEIEERHSNFKIRMRNLQFHDQIDESLFSTDIPQDYTATDMGKLDMQSSTQDDLIEGLRILAMTNEGYFPNRIDPAFYIQNAMKTTLAFERLNLSEQEEVEAGMKLSRYLLFLRFFKGKGQWHWAGNGVKLGDADKPIFWYQPADSENFRVIFGDLSVQDVAADNLNEVIKTAQAPYQPAGYTITDDIGFTCTQKDLWYILSDGQIKAWAEIQLQKGPKDAPNVVIRLPYDAGSIKSVRMAGKDLLFKHLENGTCQIDFDQALLKEGQTEMIIEWMMPLSVLPQQDGQYRTKLCPLMPATDYSLTISVESNSGWVNSEDPSKQTYSIFSSINPQPFTDAGSCSLMIKPKE